MGVGCYSSEAAGWASKRATVNLCSKGLARKENPPLRDIDLCPDKIFFSYSNIGYKRISIYGKNFSSPMKSLRAKFNNIDCEAAGRALVANFRLTQGFNGLT